MKIAWFTPFGRKSYIGKVSQSIIHYLSQTQEVDLWLSQTEDLLLTSVNKIFYLEDKKINLELCQKLSDYQAIFYNMGDNLEYHAEIYEVSKHYPGIIILHDFVMHHFFIEYLFKQNKQSIYLQMINYFYGEPGLQEATASINETIKPYWENDCKMMEYPLFEPVLFQAKGVITHSAWVAKKIQQVFAGPVIHLPLPSPAIEQTSKINSLNRQMAHSEPSEESEKFENITSTTKLLTVGNINPNKCIHSIIEMLGKNPSLTKKIHYDIVGEFNPKQQYYQYLQQLITHYSLENSVNFLGYQSDEKLVEFLNQADIAITLRYPAMEAASGSVLEQMCFGKPIIVYETGFYAELPEDAVFKIKTQQETDLLNALIKLIEDPPLRKKLQKTARHYVTQYHTAYHYAIEVIRIANEINTQEPISQLIDTVSSELRNMHVQTFMPAISKIAEEIYSFINPSPNINQKFNLIKKQFKEKISG